MEMYPFLYIGQGVKAPEELIHKLQKHARLPAAYVIVLSVNPSDQLEIVSTKELSGNYYRKRSPYVIGIAADYDEAVLLVQQIAEECFSKRGDCRLKEFLTAKKEQNV